MPLPALRISAALCCLIGLAGVGSASPGYWDVSPLFLYGEEAPGTSGGTYAARTAGPLANASGLIAFTAAIDGGSTSEVLYVASPSGVERVVAVGDVAPGLGGATYTDLGSIAFHNSCVLAFSATLSGPGPANGLFVVDGSGTRVVVLAGDPAPGTGGGSFVRFIVHEDALDFAGNVAFWAELAGGSAHYGVFVHEGGSVEARALIGEPTPPPLAGETLPRSTPRRSTSSVASCSSPTSTPSTPPPQASTERGSSAPPASRRSGG